MADQPLREIQISVKQLVFFFMASVVVAVAVFLLGVSVGRGVRDRTGGEVEQAAVPPVPVGPTIDPGPTQFEPDTLKYPELSKDPAANAKAAGKSADATPQPPPVADEPEVSEPAAPAATKAVTPAPATAPKADPQAKPSGAAPKVAAKAADQPVAPKAGAGWSVQVDAFKSRDNAEKQVASLKGKGYPAFLMPSQSGSLYNVRVGPYPQRADADRTRAKLRQEGFDPSVTR